MYTCTCLFLANNNKKKNEQKKNWINTFQGGVNNSDTLLSSTDVKAACVHNLNYMCKIDIVLLVTITYPVTKWPLPLNLCPSQHNTLTQCWLNVAIVCDAGPTFNQHCLSAWCLLVLQCISYDTIIWIACFSSISPSNINRFSWNFVQYRTFPSHILTSVKNS